MSQDPPNRTRCVELSPGTDLYEALILTQELGWESRAVLAFAAGRPGEPLTIKTVMENAGPKKCGRDRATSILNELIQAGYITPADGKGLLYQKTKIPEDLRQQVLERDGFRCVECESIKRLSVDHVFPERHGGETTLENLQTLCRPCNSEKGSKF